MRESAIRIRLKLYTVRITAFEVGKGFFLYILYVVQNDFIFTYTSQSRVIVKISTLVHGFNIN